VARTDGVIVPMFSLRCLNCILSCDVASTSYQALGGGKEGVSESADEGDTLVPLFPVWQGWTQPSVALTLRTVLMTASALTAAAGMQQPNIQAPQILLPEAGSSTCSKAQLTLDRKEREAEMLRLYREAPGFSPGPRVPGPKQGAQVKLKGNDCRPWAEGLLPEAQLGDLRGFYQTLWPNAPYSFGTYSRDSVNSDTSFLRSEVSWCKLKRVETHVGTAWFHLLTLAYDIFVYCKRHRAPRRSHRNPLLPGCFQVLLYVQFVPLHRGAGEA